MITPPARGRFPMQSEQSERCLSRRSDRRLGRQAALVALLAAATVLSSCGKSGNVSPSRSLTLSVPSRSGERRRRRRQASRPNRPRLACRRLARRHPRRRRRKPRPAPKARRQPRRRPEPQRRPVPRRPSRPRRARRFKPRRQHRRRRPSRRQRPARHPATRVVASFHAGVGVVAARCGCAGRRSSDCAPAAQAKQETRVAGRVHRGHERSRLVRA